jgi:hypothetical protein
MAGTEAALFRKGKKVAARKGLGWIERLPVEALSLAAVGRF